MEVLLVDDEPDFLESAKLFLEREDDSLDIKTANSAYSALDMLDGNNYDAIVSDYQMPNMNGLEFLETVREERGSDIPFIIFTGKGREEVAMEALNLGADRYLQKGTDVKPQYKVLADAIIQEIRHKRHWDQLQEARNRFRLMFNTIPDPAYFFNKNLKFEEVNEAFCEVIGSDKEDILGKSILEVPFLPEETVETLEEKFVENVEEKDVSPFVIEVSPEGRQTLFFEINNNIIREDGEMVGLVGIAREITEKVKMDERLSAIYESSPTSITLSTLEDGRYVEVNDAFTELTGWSSEEVLGKTAFELGIWAEPAEEQREALLEELKKEGSIKNQEFTFKTKDGEELIGLLSATTIEIGDEKYMLANVMDITEWKER